MKLIVQKLKNVGALANKQATVLTDCIQTGSTYLRTHFPFNIEKQSKCIHHCASHSVSNPNPDTPKSKSKSFYEPCFISHEDEANCFQCSNITKILMTLKGVISNHVTRDPSFEEEALELLYDLNESHTNIFAFKRQLMRSFIQNLDWEELFLSKDPTTVLIICDWWANL